MLTSLKNIDISSLTEDEMDEFIQLLELKIEYDKYNAIERFTPYDYQQNFFRGGSTHKRRFLCAANRC